MMMLFFSTSHDITGEEPLKIGSRKAVKAEMAIEAKMVAIGKTSLQEERQKIIEGLKEDFPTIDDEYNIIRQMKNK